MTEPQMRPPEAATSSPSADLIRKAPRWTVRGGSVGVKKGGNWGRNREKGVADGGPPKVLMSFLNGNATLKKLGRKGGLTKRLLGGKVSCHQSANNSSPFEMRGTWVGRPKLKSPVPPGRGLSQNEVVN